MIQDAATQPGTARDASRRGVVTRWREGEDLAFITADDGQTWITRRSQMPTDTAQALREGARVTFTGSGVPGPGSRYPHALALTPETGGEAEPQRFGVVTRWRDGQSYGLITDADGTGWFVSREGREAVQLDLAQGAAVLFDGSGVARPGKPMPQAYRVRRAPRRAGVITRWLPGESYRLAQDGDGLLWFVSEKELPPGLARIAVGVPVSFTGASVPRTGRRYPDARRVRLAHDGPGPQGSAPQTTDHTTKD